MNLQAYREQHGLTRAAFARTLGVSWVTLWKWEEGRVRPSYDNLVRIHEATDGAVSLTDIVQIGGKRRNRR